MPRYTPVTSADPNTLDLLTYLRPARSKRLRDLPARLRGALTRARGLGLVKTFAEDPFSPWIRRVALSRTGWRMLRAVRPDARADWEIDADIARLATGARIQAIDGPKGLEVHAILARGTRLGIRQRFEHLGQPAFHPSARGDDLSKALTAAQNHLDLIGYDIMRVDERRYCARMKTPGTTVSRTATTAHAAAVMALDTLARDRRFARAHDPQSDSARFSAAPAA